MRTLTVARHEVTSALRRRSFWLMTLLFPLLILGIGLGESAVSHVEGDSLQEALSPETDAQIIGYVDESGELGELPPGLPADLAPRYQSEAEARAAVVAGDISGFYLLPAGFDTSRELVLVREDLELLSAGQGPDPLFTYQESYALTGDAAVAAALVDPAGRVDVRVAGEEPGTEGASDTAATATAAQERDDTGEDELAASIASMVPYAVMFVLFFVITTSSSYLLQSVTSEKENRTAEVLLVSLHPRSLMLGKILGLGGVALLQIVVWLAGAVGVAFIYLDVPDLESLGLSPGLLGWLVAFVLLAHLAYGSMLAALGALVPSQREGTQFMGLVLVPLMVPLWFNYTLTSDPHAPLSVALSLIPLSAPVAMVTRLAAGGVPWWQPAAAAGGLLLTGYLFVVLAARIFRADKLLAMESLRWATVAQAARGLVGRS